tara:strand:- start:2786 stop:3562 length:777 start_codon:yes stop_codon:yes gene_type:complete
MPAFEGVAPGQTATMRLPIGQTYHQLLIAYSGVTLAGLRGMRLVANGKAIRTYNQVERLDIMNQFDGRSKAAGILVLDFERYGLEGRDAREITALGTGSPDDQTPITTLALELDISPNANAPALSAKAVRSAPAAAGLVTHVRRFTYNASSSGEFEISDLPKGPLINRVFVFGDGVAKMELSRDNYQEFIRNRAENELIQNNGVRQPQPGLFVYDPTEHGNGSETLATRGVQDLRFVLTMDAPADLDVVVEYLGPLGI